MPKQRARIFQFNSLCHFKETMDMREEVKRGNLLEGDKQETEINEDMKQDF